MSPDVAQLGTRFDCKVAGSSHFASLFSSNNVRLLPYTSLQVKAHNQNNWSVTIRIEYTGLRQDSYLKFICRLFLSWRSSYK